VTLLLTGLVIAARAVGPTAGGVFGRAVRALRPNMEGLDSAKGLLAQTGERSAAHRQTVREVVRARGLGGRLYGGVLARRGLRAGRCVADVLRFCVPKKRQPLFLIWSGRGESVRGPPSLLEESFVNTDALLQKWGARPAFRRTATLLLLPIYATLGIFGKRLAVLAYSTLGQFALMTTLSWTLSRRRHSRRENGVGRGPRGVGRRGVPAFRRRRRSHARPVGPTGGPGDDLPLAGRGDRFPGSGGRGRAWA
jgi:hypothetical protein